MLRADFLTRFSRASRGASHSESGVETARTATRVSFLVTWFSKIEESFAALGDQGSLSRTVEASGTSDS
jgi:hypothetical protein